MREIIEPATFPSALALRSLEAFARLAEAEAGIHGVPPDDVHFHELGALDTLVDICGAVVLLDELGIERVACSPLPFARGLVTAAHGLLPLPAPATLELLRGAPLVGVDPDGELVTPTGAALAATLVEECGPPAAAHARGVGYGAGTRTSPERPNVVRVAPRHGRDPPGDGAVVLLETNLDDLTPELVPDAVERCFAAGALDVWTVPVQMKKGRPGIVLSALARPGARARGRRARSSRRRARSACACPGSTATSSSARSASSRSPAGPVRVKLGLPRRPGGQRRARARRLRRARRSTGRAVKSVWAEALAARPATS